MWLGYPKQILVGIDCRNDFVKSLNVTLNLAMDYAFEFHTPLMWIDKEQTWALADSMGKLDYVRENTLTCYEGIPGMAVGNVPVVCCERGLERYLSHKNQRESKGVYPMNREQDLDTLGKEGVSIR